MFNDQNLNNTMDFESSINGNNNFSYNDVDFNLNQNMMNNGMSVENPTISSPRERIINRTFVHEVPQPYPFMLEK